MPSKKKSLTVHLDLDQYAAVCAISRRTMITKSAVLRFGVDRAIAWFEEQREAEELGHRVREVGEANLYSTEET